MVDFFTNAAGQTAQAPRIIRNLPTTVSQLAGAGAGAAEAAAAPVASVATEAPGFLSKLLPGTGRAFLPSLGEMLAGTGKVAGAAMKVAPYLPALGMIKDVAAPLWDDTARATQPAFQENAKWMGYAGDALKQGRYGAAAGDALTGLASTGVNLALQQIPKYTDVYNSLGAETTKPALKTSTDGQAGASKTAAATADTRPVLKMSELPQFTLGQLKMLAPFLPKQPAPVDPIKSKYLEIINQQHQEAIAAANGNAAKLKAANDMFRQKLVPVFAPAAAPMAALTPGYEVE